ncbi:hypothetical protein F9802_06830 [Bacillus aerolatus]|uniref:Uncharacterized protein n=1 Tax=Bacillus aerolatus TaxID=2653354 RepID=A0A6I1FS41_9BACI|nr:hypothetical protein [Bacillus aerolatus]KAB7707460.1 hypothetical protein F9802_06830 [Bacillus aerolatus]
MFFNLLDGLAYDLEPMAPGARQLEKRKRPFRLGRHKTDRRSGTLCHTGVTAYVRESGRWS